MAQCFSPYSKRDEMTGKMMDFPCGKCPNCLSRRISGWSFRLQQHAKKQNEALFVTLTYNSDFVPITSKGFMTLCKRDLQLFMKRLRKLMPKDAPKVSYYACGEYGGKTNRPHYHYILFNVKHEYVEQAWRIENKVMGDIHYGDVNAATVGYCLKYMSKPSKIPMHANDDRLPEFQLCSKGIGASYVNDATRAWHKADLTGRFYLPYEEGKKIAIPRYLKNKIYTDDERRTIGNVFSVTADKRNDLDDLEIMQKMQIDSDQLESYKVSRDKEKIRKNNKSSQDGRFL